MADFDDGNFFDGNTLYTPQIITLLLQILMKEWFNLMRKGKGKDNSKSSKSIRALQSADWSNAKAL